MSEGISATMPAAIIASRIRSARSDFELSSSPNMMNGSEPAWRTWPGATRKLTMAQSPPIAWPRPSSRAICSGASIPLSSGITTVCSPTIGRAASIASATCAVFTASSTTSTSPTLFGSSVAFTFDRTKSPPMLSTRSPFVCSASSDLPRTMKVTSAPFCASFPPKYPPTPPAPMTANRIRTSYYEVECGRLVRTWWDEMKWGADVSSAHGGHRAPLPRRQRPADETSAPHHTKWSADVSSAHGGHRAPLPQRQRLADETSAPHHTKWSADASSAHGGRRAPLPPRQRLADEASALHHTKWGADVSSAHGRHGAPLPLRRDFRAPLPASGVASSRAMKIAIVAFLLAAAPVHGIPGEDAKFEAIANKYVEDLLKLSPETATELGDHRYDSRLDDYSRAGVDAQIRFNQDTLAALSKIKREKLSATNRVDLRILENTLQYQIYSAQVLRGWEWNPQTYNIGRAVDSLLSREFAPPSARLKSIIGRLNQVPDVVAAAKANLKNPPKSHVETAITQNKGTISLIRNDLEPLKKAAPELQAEAEAAQKTAIDALTAYGTWLQNDLLPRANGDFRLGEEKYRRKLGLALDTDLTKEEILRRAEEELKKTQDAMYATALKLGAKPDDDHRKVIRSVLDKLADQHPTNETIIALAEKDLAETTAFVRKHDLVTVPDEPIQVTPMPEYNRGVAVASCNSPGALEKNGKTFFYISPTPAEWSPQRVETFFREY